MDMNEQRFVTGFNSGYILARFEPQLLVALFKNIKAGNSYLKGILAGQKEFERRKERDELSELKQVRHKGRDEKSLGRD